MPAPCSHPVSLVSLFVCATLSAAAGPARAQDDPAKTLPTLVTDAARAARASIPKDDLAALGAAPSVRVAEVRETGDAKSVLDAAGLPRALAAGVGADWKLLTDKDETKSAAVLAFTTIAQTSPEGAQNGKVRRVRVTVELVAVASHLVVGIGGATRLELDGKPVPAAKAAAVDDALAADGVLSTKVLQDVEKAFAAALAKADVTGRPGAQLLKTRNDSSIRFELDDLGASLGAALLASGKFRVVADKARLADLKEEETRAEGDEGGAAMAKGGKGVGSKYSIIPRIKDDKAKGVQLSVEITDDRTRKAVGEPIVVSLRGR